MVRRNRFRRDLSLLLSTAVLVAGAGACSKSTAKAGGSTPGSGSTSPLVIGASLSLTGDFADSGKAVQRGYQLWADTVNKHGGLLGRQVSVKVVDDASSTDQVVTNYQNLINRDKVDLVFGPFSSLLTVPASQVAKRYGYSFIEPAGGGPAVFDQNLNNLFFVQPAPVVKSGDVFADWVLSLPADQRPKTAAYAELDDPFASPIAENIRARFEAAGIKTVYKQVYAAETLDLGPVMAKVAAANPDVVVSGTQSADAYGQVKSMIQLKFSPKFLFMSNGANSPVEFPDKVGANNVNGVMSAGDWYPATKAAGSADFAAAYTAKFGGTVDQIDNSSAEAYAAGQLLEDVAKKTGKLDNATIISALHSGSWPTVLGDLAWDAAGRPTGSYALVQWIGGKLVPVYPSDRAQAAPVAPKPNWGG
jgi:branched-chain amino acid transport system substrate-binding protein